jgi:CRP-like cAMP-binding protein
VVTRRSAPRASVIMAAGDQIDSLYIVISGRLKVMMGDAEGKEVILSLIGPGEFFGEMGLIDDAPRSASVVTIEPCELLSISKRDFQEVPGGELRDVDGGDARPGAQAARGRPQDRQPRAARRLRPRGAAAARHVRGRERPEGGRQAACPSRTSPR